MSTPWLGGYLLCTAVQLPKQLVCCQHLEMVHLGEWWLRHMELRNGLNACCKLSSPGSGLITDLIQDKAGASGNSISHPKPCCLRLSTSQRHLAFGGGKWKDFIWAHLRWLVQSALSSRFKSTPSSHTADANPVVAFVSVSFIRSTSLQGSKSKLFLWSLLKWVEPDCPEQATGKSLAA